MALTKKVYAYSDFEEHDLETAPSLDLPALHIDKFLMPKDGGNIMLFLTSVNKQDFDSDCPFCKAKTEIIRAGKGKPRLVHDVIRNNYRVDIAILPQLYRCKKCDQRFTAPIEGIEESRQMTTRLLEYLKKECFLQSHTDLAERCGFSIETIQNIMDEQIEYYDEQRRIHPPKAPKVLGIDEKHITYEMRGTLVDVENGTLLELLENNKPATMQNAIKGLEGWDTSIKVVTTDMNNSYIKWLVDLLPKAKIVIDKFHVIQDIQKRISTVQNNLYEYRRGLIMEIENIKERQRQLAVLRIVNDNKYLFKRSMESIVRDTGDKAEKLATVMEEFPEFKFLRNLYFTIEKMYTCKTRTEAEEIWEQWQLYLPPNGKKEYQDWCEAYEFEPNLFIPFKSFSHVNFLYFKEYILNYFDEGCRFTNAATEGINNEIERINRAGNGCKFKHLRAKALYAPLLISRTNYSIKLSTIKKWIPNFDCTYTFTSSQKGTYKIITKYFYTEETKPFVVQPVKIYEIENMTDIIYVPEDKAFIPKVNELSIIGTMIRANAE